MGYNYNTDDMEGGVLTLYSLGEKITMTGRVLRILYSKPDSAYRMLLAENNDSRTFVVAGQFPSEPHADAFYEFSGTVKESKGRRQLAVSSYHSVIPSGAEALITYLTTLPGLDTKAYNIYEAFGDQSVEVLKTDPELVAKTVSGVGIKRAKAWQDYLCANEKSEAVMKELLSYGMTPKQAGKLMGEYGVEIAERIHANPYLLSTEIHGFSFSKCDLMALKSGILINDPVRITNVMYYVLRSAAAKDGHCCLPTDEFTMQVKKIAGLSLTATKAEKIASGNKDRVAVTIGKNRTVIDRKALADAITRWRGTREVFYYRLFETSEEDIENAFAFAGNALVVEDGFVYLRKYHEALGLIRRSVDRLSAFPGDDFANVGEIIDDVCREEGITLEAKQRLAVETICGKPEGLYVLTGSAGCGKTFTLKIIIKVLERLQHRPLDIKLLAPTGKAAKVASNATGLPTSTIHMALGISEDGLPRYTVTGDAIVVDEFSMVDVLLGAQLLSSLSPMSKVILLGDTQQLPSIGPGLLLQNLMACEQIPSVMLDVVKRQGADSGILYNANNIVAGKAIETQITKAGEIHSGDAFVEEISCATEGQRKVLSWVERLLEHYPLEEIQALCPQHKGELGTDALNFCLQSRFNKSESDGILHKEVTVGGKVQELKYKPGDKVIHIRNNYKIQWYEMTSYGLREDIGHVGIINGETGMITDIEMTGGHKIIWVQYEGGYVKYTDDFDELDHAWALTIHKSQGSQWAAVITPITTTSKLLLNRNLLYTAYTRAAEVQVTLQNRGAVDYAIKNDSPKRRHPANL